MYSCKGDFKSLEDVFGAFNFNRPDDYHARSLSVSDIVEVKTAENMEPGFYFCDSFGFQKVDFEPTKMAELDTIRVVLVEPGKVAREARIGTKLSDLQAAVGGDIEQFCPYEDEVALICDEEGKLCGKDLNRAVYDEDGQMICSTSFIDGRRYHDDNSSKGRMRAASDELCREYGLSVIENRKNQRNKNYAERMAEKNGMPTLLSQMKEDIDKAIAEAVTREQFFTGLKRMGYTIIFRGNHKDELNAGHYIDIDTKKENDAIFSLTPPGYAHPWRPSNHFGMEYSYSALVKRADREKQMPWEGEERAE